MNDRLRAWDLIVALLFADESPDRNRRLERTLGSPVMPWPAFLWLANVHAVTATVWQALTERGLADLVPEDARDYLSSFYEINYIRNEAIRHQLADCIETLSARGVQTLALKGAMYLLMDAPRLESRFLTDIDLLVPEDAADEAWDALIARGYTPSPTGHLRPPNHHHLVPLVHDAAPVAVELHTASVPRHAQAALPTDGLWQTARTSAESASDCALPTLTDAAMLAFLHAEVVDRNLALGRVALRTLHDLDALSRLGEIDWHRNLERADAIDARSRLRTFLYLFDILCAAQTIPDLKFNVRDSARYSLTRAVIGRPEIGAAVMTLDKLSERSLRERYGLEAGTLTVNAYRARRSIEMLANGLRRLHRPKRKANRVPA